MGRASIPRIVIPAVALFGLLAPCEPAAAARSDLAVALPFTVQLQDAPPFAIYDAHLDSSDSNSPVEWSHGRVLVFVSHWDPIGHSYRRSGPSLDHLDPGSIKIDIRQDESPGVGKWLEATYLDPDGTLFGWYHAETDGPCGRKDAKIPIIGAVMSRDDGATWTDLGEIISTPTQDYNCDMQNGFFAGGLGDFSVITDRGRRFFYFFFSNYDRHRYQQGIAIARVPYTARYQPKGQVIKWNEGKWSAPGIGGRTTPIFPALRNFRHPDPDSFWGPAVHFNTYLGGYVMLLNRTVGGESDWAQEGIYLSSAKSLSNPGEWTVPEKIMDGGDWYPQIIGLKAGETDKLSGREGRFFMSGYSAWNILFQKKSDKILSGSSGNRLVP